MAFVKGRLTRRGLVGALLSLVVIGLACSTGITTDARPGQRPRTGGPQPGANPAGAPANLDPALGLLVGAPVYDGDFADPYVLVDGGKYYAYATNTKGANLPVIMSSGGGSGQYFEDAFPQLPSWSTPGFVWAPAVYAVAGRYVLYYTTFVNSSKRQCVSRAVASSPLGPFVDDSTEPLVCQTTLGGTIDPSVVADVDGKTWLLFKNDGNCCGIPTSLWTQQLSADGLSVVGDPSTLIAADQPWEGNLIEAPSIVIDKGIYYLFYSANAWDTASYAIGYARCASMTGPCTKPQASPWMSSTVLTKGPGGQEFYSGAGQLFMVYHGWMRDEVGYAAGGERRLYLDSIRIIDGHPERVGAEQAFSVLIFILAVAAALAVLAAAFLYRHHRRRRLFKQFTRNQP